MIYTIGEGDKKRMWKEEGGREDMNQIKEKKKKG